MLIRLLSSMKSFRRSLLNHFISKVVHDLFVFDVKFWQMDHVFIKFASAVFCLICYCACAETATVVLLALPLYKLKFSVPDFIHNLSFDLVFEPFCSLLVRMRSNSHKTTSGVKFDLKFDFPVPDYLYGKKFSKLDHDFMYF